MDVLSLLSGSVPSYFVIGPLVILVIMLVVLAARKASPDVPQVAQSSPATAGVATGTVTPPLPTEQTPLQNAATQPVTPQAQVPPVQHLEQASAIVHAPQSVSAVVPPPAHIDPPLHTNEASSVTQVTPNAIDSTAPQQSQVTHLSAPEQIHQTLDTSVHVPATPSAMTSLSSHDTVQATPLSEPHLEVHQSQGLDTNHAVSQEIPHKEAPIDSAPSQPVATSIPVMEIPHDKPTGTVPPVASWKPAEPVSLPGDTTETEAEMQAKAVKEETKA